MKLEIEYIERKEPLPETADMLPAGTVFWGRYTKVFKGDNYLFLRAAGNLLICLDGNIYTSDQADDLKVIKIEGRLKKIGVEKA